MLVTEIEILKVVLYLVARSKKEDKVIPPSLSGSKKAHLTAMKKGKH